MTDAPIRIAIDSDIVDLIADTPGVLRALEAAGTAGRLVFVSSHVIRDQLGKTPCSARRRVLLEAYNALPKVEVATHGFVLDVSRLNEARFEDPTTTGVSLEDVTTRGRGKMHDALIAATASGEADVFVVKDHGLRRKVEQAGMLCELWTFDQLVAFAQTDKSGREGED